MNDSEQIDELLVKLLHECDHEPDEITKYVVIDQTEFVPKARAAILQHLTRKDTKKHAPLKFTAGTLLDTPVAGAVEYDGKDIYFTPPTTRYKLDGVTQQFSSKEEVERAIGPYEAQNISSPQSSEVKAANKVRRQIRKNLGLDDKL